MPSILGRSGTQYCCHGDKTLYPLKGLHDRASPRRGEGEGGGGGGGKERSSKSFSRRLLPTFASGGFRFVYKGGP